MVLLRTLRFCECSPEHTSTVLEKPPADVRRALLDAPEFCLRAVYFAFCSIKRVARLLRYA
jgi:hypothetical protein